MVDELVSARLFQAAIPAELGGLGVDPLTLLELVEEISRQDGSTGWCLGMGALIGGIAAAMLPEAGAREVFADPRRTICAGGYPPQGRARREGDGFRVRGQFSFGSGCRHADWMVCTCVVEDAAAAAGGEPEVRSFCVPTPRVRLHDNWQVSGLEGTASCDYSLEDEYVPERFSYLPMQWGSARGQAFYGLPLLSVAAVPHIGFALGVARRALEEIAAQARGRTRLSSAAALSERPAFQRDFARAQTRLRAARALAFDSLSALWEAHLAGGRVELSQRAHLTAALTHAYETSLETTDFAFRGAGARALFRGHRLQRCQRDIQAGGQHILASEESWERVGQALLGVGEPRMV